MFFILFSLSLFLSSKTRVSLSHLDPENEIQNPKSKSNNNSDASPSRVSPICDRQSRAVAAGRRTAAASSRKQRQQQQQQQQQQQRRQQLQRRLLRLSRLPSSPRSTATTSSPSTRRSSLKTSCPSPRRWPTGEEEEEKEEKRRETRRRRRRRLLLLLLRPGLSPCSSPVSTATRRAAPSAACCSWCRMRRGSRGWPPSARSAAVTRTSRCGFLRAPRARRGSRRRRSRTLLPRLPRLRLPLLLRRSRSAAPSPTPRPAGGTTCSTARAARASRKLWQRGRSRKKRREKGKNAKRKKMKANEKQIDNRKNIFLFVSFSLSYYRIAPLATVEVSSPAPPSTTSWMPLYRHFPAASVVRCGAIFSKFFFFGLRWPGSAGRLNPSQTTRSPGLAARGGSIGTTSVSVEAQRTMPLESTPRIFAGFCFFLKFVEVFFF